MFSILSGAALAGLVVAVISVWTQVAARSWRGRPLLDFQPRPEAAWDLLDVVVTVGLYFSISILVMGVINHWFGITDVAAVETAPVQYQRWFVGGGALASLATLSVSVMVVLLRHRSLRDLGFAPGTLVRDMKLGVAAFLVLAPPTYGMQFVLVQWFKSRHPIVEQIRENPDAWLIGASVFSAVAVAPVFEEYLFRALLQGWLEKLMWSAHSSYRYFVDQEDAGRVDVGKNGWDQTSAPLATSDSADVPGDAARDDGSPSNQQAHSDAGMRSSDRGTGTMAACPPGAAGILPILVSSMLFAALHIQHGPDWIPLLFLAVGLGYLYRQTHRLLPCIIVHLLLNGCSMGMFLVELLS